MQANGFVRKLVRHFVSSTVSYKCLNGMAVVTIRFQLMSKESSLFLFFMLFNSFSAKGNIEVFCKQCRFRWVSSWRAVSPEISIVCLLFMKIVQVLIKWEIETPDFKHGRVYFKQFGAERVKSLLLFKHYIGYITDFSRYLPELPALLTTTLIHQP